MPTAVEVRKIPMTVAEVSAAHISGKTPDEVQAYLTERAARILDYDPETDAIVFSGDLRGAYDFGFCYARCGSQAGS